MSGCLNFFSNSVNKTSSFTIKVLGWLFNTSNIYIRKSIYLGQRAVSQCNLFLLLFILPCGYFFSILPDVIAPDIFSCAFKILQKSHPFLVSTLFLDSSVDLSGLAGILIFPFTSVYTNSLF